jgi:hypothetical protein
VLVETEFQTPNFPTLTGSSETSAFISFSCSMFRLEEDANMQCAALGPTVRSVQ